jgi:sulfite reductase (ferredoxin)
MYVGGGLGAVPYQAKLFDSFIPVEELLPLAQAIARVFARLGEKKNRSRARIKFLVQDLGIEKFKELVLEERKTLPFDPRWTEFVRRRAFEEEPLKPAGELPLLTSVGFERWRKPIFGRKSRMATWSSTVTLAAGRHHRESTALLGGYCAALHARNRAHHGRAELCDSLGERKRFARPLQSARCRGLGRTGSGAIVDIVACPGTDTCKLGISSSRGLAAELRKRLDEKSVELDESVENLHIKISGCFNSCGQHHVADLGFYGVSRKMAGHAVPHFQVVLGGEWANNGGSYGLPVVAIPSKRIPEVVARLTGPLRREAHQGRDVQGFRQARWQS